MYPENLAVVSLNKAHHFLLFKSVTDYSCVAVGVVELDHLTGTFDPPSIRSTNTGSISWPGNGALSKGVCVCVCAYKYVQVVCMCVYTSK